MVIGKSQKKVAAVAGLAALATCIAPVLAATTLAAQTDIGKMWKTGGIVVKPSVAVSGAPFKTAVAFTNPKKGSKPWDAQAGAHPTGSINKGDVLLASFYIRSTGASGQVTFNFEDATKFQRSVSVNLKPTGKWTKVSIPFASRDSYGSGKWQIDFQLGTAAQTVQIGNFTLVDYAKTKSVSSLPKSGM